MKKADKYILIGILILLLASALGVFIFKSLLASPGARAVISQDGQVIDTIDLAQVAEPYELVFTTDHGGSNTVYVEKGRIKFSQANCPDQLCVQTGFLSSSHDIAVCLPHGLFIEIEGGNQGDIDILAH